MHRNTGVFNTIIIEYGFANSKKDDGTQLLKHWQDYAKSVVRAFCNYIGHPYKTVGKEKPKVEEDKNTPSKWAEKAWEEAVRNGYFDGTRPKEIITREEAAVVISRVRNSFLKLIIDQEERIKELDNR